MCNCIENNNYCNDYSLKTANTGIAIVNTANINLNGSGNLTTVFTAGMLGSIVKSIIIKATEPVTTGMIRLFIQKQSPTVTVLYKEVPIQVTPILSATPTPTPVLPMFEIALLSNLELQAGYSLVATTQISNSFAIFVEGLNWEYPDPLPTDCCNFKQVSAVTGINVISTANPNLNGTGNIQPIFTAPPVSNSNGSLIKNIVIKALQSTSINGMIRIFLSADAGSTFTLMREIQVPQTTQSGFDPSYKQIVELNYNLQPGYVIGMSTQNPESFAVTVEAESWSYPI